MTRITIHPPSFLAGCALLGVAILASGAFQATPIASRHGLSAPLEVTGIPDPRAMVVVRQGAPLQLPQGKLFVLTALGLSSLPVGVGGCVILANGVAGPGFQTASGLDYGWRFPINESTPSVREAPSWVVEGPASIEVFGPTGSDVGRAWGYILSPDPGRSVALPTIDSPVSILGVNDPRDWRAFSGPGPHLIPPGKLFVVAAASGSLDVDGVTEVTGGQGQPLPPGLTVRGGSELIGWASGFLIDEKLTVGTARRP